MSYEEEDTCLKGSHIGLEGADSPRKLCAQGRWSGGGYGVEEDNLSMSVPHYIYYIKFTV
jgi:hypothetical protein